MNVCDPTAVVGIDVGDDEVAEGGWEEEKRSKSDQVKEERRVWVSVWVRRGSGSWGCHWPKIKIIARDAGTPGRSFPTASIPASGLSLIPIKSSVRNRPHP